MLPSDVVMDIDSKKRFYADLVRLTRVIKHSKLVVADILTTVISDAIYFGLIKLLQSGKVPRLTYRFDHFEQLEEFWRLWDSADFRGTYIYRGTSARYLPVSPEHLLTSAGRGTCINCSMRRVTYWSVYPVPALSFATSVNNPVVLVADYDPEYCTKVDYYVPNINLNAIIEEGDRKRFIAFAEFIYGWEAEVRCYDFPYSKVKYKLFGSDLLDLFKASYDESWGILDYDDVIKAIKEV